MHNILVGGLLSVHRQKNFFDSQEITLSNENLNPQAPAISR